MPPLALSFRLRTKSYAGAVRAAQSVTQRLEDYWLRLATTGYGYTSYPSREGRWCGT